MGVYGPDRFAFYGNGNEGLGEGSADAGSDISYSVDLRPPDNGPIALDHGTLRKTAGH